MPQDDVGEDKPAVDDKKENIIPEPETTEIASQSAKIMDLFRGQEDILEKVVRVSQLISENEDILYVDKLINKYKAKEKPAVLIEELISGITSNSNLDDLESVLNNSNLTAEDANEIISLLNQFIVEFGYFDSTTDFSGINGVLRFTPKECANSQNASENINFDFCILTSTDISTKNLIGYNNFTSKVSNEYQASHNNIKINWENNHFNTKIELSDKKHIILGDDHFINS